MSHDEDRALERLLESFDNNALLEDGALDSPEAQQLREYTELWALLPFALEPVKPSGECRDGVLAAIRGSAADPASSEPAVSAPLAFPSTSSVPASSHVLRLVAAALAVAVVGLGAFSTWIFGEYRRQGERIEEIQLAVAESQGRESDLQATLGEIQRLRGLVTRTGARVCRLRPFGDSPAQPVARAAVYFDTEAQEYFLAARDLNPCSEGFSYRLWFMVDGRPVPGRSFNVSAGKPVTLGSNGMPADATAMMVTYQRVGTEEPLGERILWGDESEEML